MDSLPISLLILADDLTGAADCAARCRHAGLPASISLRPPQPPLPTGALAFTSDSRHLSPSAAAERVAQIVADLVDLSDVLWYKKIDSTLRGNLGSELDAMLDHLAAPSAVVCPAFPAQRRGLRNGFLVHDEIRDGAPHLPTLLAEQSTRTIATLKLEDVRGGPQTLARRLASAQAQGGQLLVVDAESQEDLQTIVEAAGQALPDAILCGSAGLVGALAADRAHARAVEPAPHPANDGVVLAVIGSGSPMAQRQLRAVCTSGVARCLEVEPESALHSIPGWKETSSGKLVIHLPPPNAEAGLDGPHARRLASSLADAAKIAIDHLQPDRLILSGGDTAIHVLERLGIERLSVHDELMPGIPLTQGVDSSGCVRSVVLKAGNHGDEQTLVELMG